MAKPAAKPTAKAAPSDAAAAPAKSNKLLIIIIAVLVLVVAGGAGWYFTQDHAPAAEHAKGAKAAPAAAAPQQPKYIPLGEKFTVNLQQEEGDRYLQVGITLKILDAKLEETMKATMPEIRSKLLLLLSSKKPSELASSEGKQRLVQQVIAEVDAILGMDTAPVAAPAAAKTSGVVDVLFTDFIIQ